MTSRFIYRCVMGRHAWIRKWVVKERTVNVSMWQCTVCGRTQIRDGK